MRACNTRFSRTMKRLRHADVTTMFSFNGSSSQFRQNLIKLFLLLHPSHYEHRPPLPMRGLGLLFPQLSEDWNLHPSLNCFADVYKFPRDGKFGINFDLHQQDSVTFISVYRKVIIEKYITTTADHEADGNELNNGRLCGHHRPCNVTKPLKCGLAQLPPVHYGNGLCNGFK